MYTAAGFLLAFAWPSAIAAHVLGAPALVLRADNDTSGNDTSPTPWVPTCRLPAIGAVDGGMGFDYQGGCVSGTGTLRGFMLFIDFPDAVATAEDTTQELYDTIVPGAIDFYNEASYEKLELNITADTSTFYRMPASTDNYRWSQTANWRDQLSYIQDALDAYTNNGARPPPSEVDVLYVVATRKANNWINRSVTSQVSIDTRQGARIAKKAVTMGALDWDLSSVTLAHETGHTFCLSDYYPVDQSGPITEYVGGFSVMGATDGIAPDFFAWDKWRMGWLRDDAIDCILSPGTTTHTLSPLATGPSGTKAVVVATNQTNALVAEVRVVGKLDARVCAPGVLLYTVDTAVRSGEGPLRVLDATRGSGGCGVGNYDDHNDGTLSLKGPVSSYEVPGWGVTVTVVDESDDNYTIQVENSNKAD
jgi:M6 family metalloprotease-like protein